jgi:hypothetical protein
MCNVRENPYILDHVEQPNFRYFLEKLCNFRQLRNNYLHRAKNTQGFGKNYMFFLPSVMGTAEGKRTELGIRVIATHFETSHWSTDRSSEEGIISWKN